MLRAAGERPLMRVPHCLNHPPKMSRSRAPTPRGYPATMVVPNGIGCVPFRVPICYAFQRRSAIRKASSSSDAGIAYRRSFLRIGSWLQSFAIVGAVAIFLSGVTFMWKLQYRNSAAAVLSFFLPFTFLCDPSCAFAQAEAVVLTLDNHQYSQTELVGFTQDAFINSYERLFTLENTDKLKRELDFVGLHASSLTKKGVHQALVDQYAALVKDAIQTLIRKRFIESYSPPSHYQDDSVDNVIKVNQQQVAAMAEMYKTFWSAPQNRYHLI